ncbi:hypothetical protein CHS0354_014266 [Potamilus streckersoni]|uniref:Uncharacterized protein n=1 Tax=Potamilus streckersoni TaxID=2493646 RepID=A0AAE0TB21_9BIVA|nr:hypothetical protein CHS0354_014266 [Potamilus streckersoni]
MGCVFSKSTIAPKAIESTTAAKLQAPTRTTLARPSSHATIGTITDDFFPVEATSRSVRTYDNDNIRTLSSSTRKTDTKSAAGKVSITNVNIRPRSEVTSVAASAASRSVLSLDNDSIRTLSASTRMTDTKSEAGKVSTTKINIRPHSEIKSIGTNSDLTIEEVDSDLEDTYKTLSQLPKSPPPRTSFVKNGVGGVGLSKNWNQNKKRVPPSNPNTPEPCDPDHEETVVAVVHPFDKPEGTEIEQIHVPRDIYVNELARENRKRKRQYRKERKTRHYDDTPRVPKPGDPIATDADLQRARTHGSVTTVSVRPWSETSIRSHTTVNSGESRPGTTSTRVTFASEATTISDIFEDQENLEKTRYSSHFRGHHQSKTSLRDVTINAVSTPSWNRRYDPYGFETTKDIMDDINIKYNVLKNIESSYSNDRYMYTLHERRPISDTRLNRRFNIGGKPPLPPGTVDKFKPLTSNARSQSYSRHLNSDGGL